jgi:hypothetical protein
VVVDAHLNHVKPANLLWLVRPNRYYSGVALRKLQRFGVVGG